MKVNRSREPILWALFGGGGMASALVLPVIVAVLWVASPLRWIEPPTHARLLELVQSPWVRIFMFGLVTLSLFHWAHRFRYTLYDGLQLHHMNQLIAVLTYGVATFATLIAAYVLWAVP